MRPERDDPEKDDTVEAIKRPAPRQAIPDIAPALLEKEAITADQVKAITLASQVGDFRRGIDPGDPTFKIAVLLGYAKPGEVAVEVAKALGIVTYVMVDGFPVDPLLPVALPRDFIEKHAVLPLVRDGNNFRRSNPIRRSSFPRRSTSATSSTSPSAARKCPISSRRR